MRTISALAQNPNAVFGLLVAQELGRSTEQLAERAGVTSSALDELLARARAGELRRVGSANGEGVTLSVPAPSPSIPERKPAPAVIAARDESPSMTTAANTGPGSKPQLGWVNVDLIDVDKTYQRDADLRSVARIVADFRWDHFGAVVLAPKDGGRFNCTDGQHRVLAAREHPDVTEVPALITSLDGAASEASNFLTINRSRRAVSTIEIYWAGVASEDPDTLRVRDAVAAAGCEVVRSQAAYKPGMTGAVGAISRCLQNYGDAATIRALKVLRQAWPSDAKALRGSLITALARIYKANDVVNDERMIKVLARTITELFNKGLSTNTIYFGESR